METKITRLFDEKKISYRLLPHEKPVYTCEEAASERKVPLHEMLKCILLVDKTGKYALACLPADVKLDPKKVQGALGCKRFSFASSDEITRVLGYVQGAVPPLLLKENIPIVFDSRVQTLQKVNISSGDPKAGLELSSKDLISLINPIIVDLCKE